MTPVAITSTNRYNATKYVDAVTAYGGVAQVLTPSRGKKMAPPHLQDLLQGVGGLLLTGGPDISPELYGETLNPVAGVKSRLSLDQLEMVALQQALERDMPVLAVCRGMQLLNVAFGGSLLQDIPGHHLRRKNGAWVSAYHQIYLSPGSKLGAILGTGGFFKVNSQHHQGLYEAQRSPRLLTSAYSLEDGIVEGLESPEHDWVVGVQCHPERREEVPRVFANLFAAFVERAASKSSRRTTW